MPDKRKHRGQHPADAQLFSAEQLPRLRQAAGDLSWLLTRGYAEKASLKLVGDRYRLRGRQRQALARITCSRQARELRLRREASPAQLVGARIFIDAFNLLITVESALSGGLIFHSQDNCYRDLASIHGSYKRVSETHRAIVLCGETLAALRPAYVCWLLDRPVSNSGRLKKLLLETAEAYGWEWQVELPFNPDAELAAARGVVITSDSGVLNEVSTWFNLARRLIDAGVPDAKVIRLFD